MAGRGAAPKETGRRSRDPLARGNWQGADAVGWQHGEVPEPPARLSEAARETWDAWFSAWFAAHWTPDDLPMLRVLIRLYGRILTAKATGAERSEFRQLADSYGITPKGQQDRRWTRPAGATEGQKKPPVAPYGHLRVVNE